MPATFSIIGLALNLIGVSIIQQKDEGAKVLDVEYGNLGRLGLIAVLNGTAFQIIGAIVPP